MLFRTLLPTWVALAVFLAAFVIYPWYRSKGIRATPTKVAALAVALGIAIYTQTWMTGIILLGPLSLIWFPEHWGSYTGFIQGGYIDQPTPPVLVAVMGWFFLVGFPLLILWIGL